LQSRKSKNKKRKADSEDEEDAYEPDEEEEKPRKSKSKKVKKEEPEEDEEEEEEDVKPAKKSKSKSKSKAKAKPEPAAAPVKGGRKKKVEEEVEVWKWWEEKEKKKDDGTKWQFLQHKGPLFAADYEPIPKDVRFYYDGKKMRLSRETEEVATFYGRMLDHDYTTKEVFNTNYFKCWRKVMTEEEKETIKDLSKCNFKEIDAHYKKVSEQRKGRGKEERKGEREKNEAIQKEYGFCLIDGHNEKIGNFRIEPPGLFRGRGEHPKQGMLKLRVRPEEVIINCSKDSNIPDPPKGHKWKKVQHDNTVTWLASWTENIQNQGRDSPIFLQFSFLFSKSLLNCF
jgi:DNA topoisomerase-1